MKVIFKMQLLLSLIIFLGSSGMANAQRIVHIAPTAVGIINTVINGDTLANGNRVDPNTIYELERGTDKYYIFNGTITNVGYPLHIRATGTGDRPKLVPGVLSGGISSQLFLPRADLTLEGLYLTDQDNSNTVYAAHIVSLAAENIRFTCDDCYFHGDRAACFELDAHNQRAFCTNTIFSYVFLNGRAIDRRGNKLDSLVVQNCTFINIGSNPLRWGGTAYANYIKFDHNTYVDCGEDVAQLGEVVELIYTNNLIINDGWKGTENDGSPAKLWVLKPLTSPDLAAKTQSLTIRNNNFWLDPQIVSFYSTLNVSSGSNNFPIQERIWGDDLTKSLIDSASFFHQPVAFTHGPSMDSLKAALKQIWEQLDGNRDGGTIFDNGPTGVDIYGNPLYGIFPFDLSYNTNATSYTAGDNGFPLGDLNWFPAKKAQWLLTDVKDNESENAIPHEFSLEQNYPNPFNPSTAINFSIPKSGNVKLAIYDILGREVELLIDKEMNAGTHKVNWNATNYSTGVYFYTISTQGFTSTKKMILIK